MPPPVPLSSSGLLGLGGICATKSPEVERAGPGVFRAGAVAFLALDDSEDCPFVTLAGLDVWRAFPAPVGLLVLLVMCTSKKTPNTEHKNPKQRKREQHTQRDGHA